MTSAETTSHSMHGPLLRIVSTFLCALIAVFSAGLLVSVIEWGEFPFIFSFGFLGLIVFFGAFPWFLLMAFLGGTSLCCACARGLAVFRYRSKILSFVVLLVVALGSGFLLSRTPLYDVLRPRPPNGKPPIGSYGISRFHNVFLGTIAEIREQAYLLTTPEGQTLLIEITSGTQFPRGRGIATGDSILVLGELRRGTVRAFGIRKTESMR